MMMMTMVSVTWMVVLDGSSRQLEASRRLRQGWLGKALGVSRQWIQDVKFLLWLTGQIHGSNPGQTGQTTFSGQFRVTKK
ncbi:hypothetical protein HanRHA438_Chr08g0347391 [Helianthus annuus]|nr:hypothetical protein HanIR_Chr08g0362781 [Helianthus annuus]KAJ0897592.1 hypothetical protein HanRHA438_Chr08g0347391 [Helianthus annuus]